MKTQLTFNIRVRIWIVIIGLALSGITAFPIETELAFFVNHQPDTQGFLTQLLDKIYQAVKATNRAYPFLSYGTDWLAFAPDAGFFVYWSAKRSG